MDFVSISASIASLFTLAVQTATVINSLVSNFKIAERELKDAAATIESLHNVLEELTSSSEPFGSDMDPALGRVILGLTSTLGELSNRVKSMDTIVKKGGSQKLALKLSWLEKAKEIQRFSSIIEGYKSTLSVALQIRILKESKKTPDSGLFLSAVKAVKNMKRDTQEDEKSIEDIRSFLNVILSHSLEGLDRTNTASCDKSNLADEPEIPVRTATIGTHSNFRAWMESTMEGLNDENERALIENYLRRKAGSRTPVQPLPSDRGATPTPSPDIQLIITDLRKPNTDELLTERIFTHANESVQNLIQHLRLKGYSDLTGFKISDRNALVGPVTSLLHPSPVRVTSGESCYRADKGLEINVNESFVQFYNSTLLHRPFAIPAVKVSQVDDGIEIENGIDGAKTRIQFKRTIRTPDDGVARNKPPDLGRFPLIKATDLKNSGTKTMRARGGFVLPVLQREAMFVSCVQPESSSDDIAVKISTGGVNIITGLDTASYQQDYFIMSRQKRVDGYLTKQKSLMRQFVAMPFGSKYSVETQVNGFELGGLQLEIAPLLKNTVSFRKFKQHTSRFHISYTPKDFSLGPGTWLEMAPTTRYIGPCWQWGTESDGIFDWQSSGDQWGENYNNKVTKSPRPPGYSRPSNISDLFLSVNTSPNGLLVLEAVPPTRVELEDHETQQTIRLRMSPFISSEYFKSIVLSALKDSRQRHYGPGYTESSISTYKITIREPSELHGNWVAELQETPQHQYLPLYSTAYSAYETFGLTQVLLDDVFNSQSAAYYADETAYDISLLSALSSFSNPRIPLTQYLQCHSPESDNKSNWGVDSDEYSFFDADCEPTGPRLSPRRTGENGITFSLTKVHGDPPPHKPDLDRALSESQHYRRIDSESLDFESMAVAKGGYIYNSLHEDSRHEWWNWKSGCLFEVQLLNTVMFEAATGFSAPVYPLAYEEYVRARLSFSPHIGAGGSCGLETRDAPDKIQSVQQLDSKAKYTLGAHSRTDGVLLGCIICEQMLCSAMIEPCHHCFCTLCLTARPRKIRACPLCQKKATQVKVYAATMPSPFHNSNLQICPAPATSSPRDTDRSQQRILTDLSNLCPTFLAQPTSPRSLPPSPKELEMP